MSPAPSPKVNIPLTIFNVSIIANHFQSPLNKAGQKPKKNTVHENPAFVCLTWLVVGFLKLTIIIDLFLHKSTAFNDNQIIWSSKTTRLKVYHFY